MATRTDPVCGMQVDDSSPEKSEFEGEEYSFCSNECRRKFDREPERYSSQGVQSDRQARGGASS